MIDTLEKQLGLQLMREDHCGKKYCGNCRYLRSFTKDETQFDVCEFAESSILESNIRYIFAIVLYPNRTKCNEHKPKEEKVGGVDDTGKKNMQEISGEIRKDA